MLSERIKEVRKHFHLSQTAFGEKVGASIDVIKNLEYGRAKPNETLLSHICTIYGIDEHWLRTGEGDMFAGKSAEDLAIENAIRDASSSPAIRALLIAYSRLNDHNRAVFEQFVEDYVSEFQAQATAESVARDEAIFDVPSYRVPILGEAVQDGSVETKYAAMKEQKELQQDLREELSNAE